MIDEEGTQRTFDDFHRLWVDPELRRRFGEAGPPPEFRIFQCLVRLPPGEPHIVEFNDEVPWSPRCKIAPDTHFEKGDPAYVHQIEHVESVAAPEHDGKPVAFVYLHRVPGAGFRMIFDGCPAPASGESEDEGPKWKYSDTVCEYLNAVLREKAIRFYDEQQGPLASIGLWAIPSLLPSPLSRCTHLVQNGKEDEARAVVVRHCCPDWLEARLEGWLTVPELAARGELLTQALAAHREGRYILAIHALVPQFEGIMTDRMVRSSPPGEKGLRPGWNLKQFRDRALQGDAIDFSSRRVIESTGDFFLNGPVRKSFTVWSDELDSMFANRHALAHGKFIEALYTEENSVKAFLLLDTLAEILRMMGSAATPSQGS